ncbi:MAG: hypothetical protein QNJ05_01810 [Woeseiaceae bacterium]|nr:hypothetical protein [Woeseiaceae bacterium]
MTITRITAACSRYLRTIAITLTCLLLASCEPPQVYGSIGYSTFDRGFGVLAGSGLGMDVRIGGRIL